MHSEWSHDTGEDASMARACERALELGVPAVAFTEHADYRSWQPTPAPGAGPASQGWFRRLDIPGYLACVEECRQRYPALRIRSGMEAGEPHLFDSVTDAFVTACGFDRVLGSLHGIPDGGRLVSVRSLYTVRPAAEVVRRYFAELLQLVKGSGLFQVLAHVDFPRRYWPAAAGRYDESTFEEEYRGVLRELANSGRALEINTKSPLASVAVLRWWRDEGGDAVSFGSDAHVPWVVGNLFEVAVDVVEAAGFRPGRDAFDFWRR